MPRGTLSWTSNFDRFLIDFDSQLGPSEPSKSLKFHWFYRYFAVSGIFKSRSIFDSILVPTCLRFSPQNPSKFNQKSILKGTKKIIDFRIDFYTVLAPTWTHFGPQVGAILALKIAQEPPKMSPKTHLGARTRPDPQNASKMEPQTSQNDAPDPSFWIDFLEFYPFKL